MTIFAVLLPRPQPDLTKIIQREFPDEFWEVTETQWLISSALSVVEVTAKLGIHDPRNPPETPSGDALIFATSAYYGRAPATTWDWIRSRLERAAHG